MDEKDIKAVHNMRNKELIELLERLVREELREYDLYRAIRSELEFRLGLVPFIPKG